MGETIVRLYKCGDCGKLRYEYQFAKGEGCKCGSMKVRIAEPTRWNRIKFFIDNPSMIKVWYKENVCKRN